MTETPKSKPPKHQESVRDTVESILFALVLAFLFRTFEAEAFVIPTGSMAPTLYGRHKETTCQQCGFRIVVGASDEVDSETGYLWENARVKSAICPNCRFENKQIYGELAFNGDRILVNKYPYELWEPSRWDVFVFKWPEEPDTNYIKRLVGLPGEQLRIRRGNVYLLDGSGGQILRKEDPSKQRTLQIPVYDNNHVARALIEAGWPERWAAVKASQDVKAIGGWQQEALGWSADSEKRTFSIAAEKNGEPHWLRYRHLVPQPQDWRAIMEGGTAAPHARLIGDFCGYNAYTGMPGARSIEAADASEIDPGIYWVPDLTLSFDVEIGQVADGGEFTVELVEGVNRFRCRINCTTGEAVLEEVNDQLNGRTRELARAKTELSGPGAYEISFANVDDRICLWVDGTLVEFGEGALLDVAGATANQLPTESDLSPAGIASKGVSATVSDLLLERDIYYRADFAPGDPNYLANEHFERDLAESLYNPQRWAEIYQEQADRLDTLDLSIPEGHYLALGDNSPRSRDSRLWEPGLKTVPRKFLVGKAFWIYWPHGVPFLNDGRGFAVWSNYEKVNNGPVLRPVDDYPKHTFPFYPQFWRMERIR